jgi:hypothetical protein
VGLGDLAFFAARGGFSDGGGFGTASGFDTLRSSGASGLFCLAERPAHSGVGLFGLVGPRSLSGLMSDGLCCYCGGFSFRLGEESLFAHLLGGAMSQLRAIFAARCGEVAILCSMQIGPGVEDGHIFRGLRYCRIISLVRAARIHLRVPVQLELVGF